MAVSIVSRGRHMAALEMLSAAGIPTGVMVAPIIPGLTAGFEGKDKIPGFLESTEEGFEFRELSGHLRFERRSVLCIFR